MSYQVQWKAEEVGGEENDSVQGSQNPHPLAENARKAGHPEFEPYGEALYARADDFEYARERRIYRARTVGMLRRYMRYSIETGRLPSLVGREFFRSNVTKYQVTTFEDRVIFVHDVETCLQRLDEFSRQVLGRVVLQEYGHEEAARLLGCTRMTVHRKLLEALDTLTNILLEVELLDPLSTRARKSCQGGETSDFLVSDCEKDK